MRSRALARLLSAASLLGVLGCVARAFSVPAALLRHRCSLTPPPGALLRGAEVEERTAGLGAGAASTPGAGLVALAAAAVAVRGHRRSSGPALRAAATADGTLSKLDPQKAVVRKLNDAAEFVTPALWNKPLFRGVVLVLGGICAGKVVPFAGMVHISAYGTWLGANVWTTFIAGLTMFKNLPRQQFGKLQSKLFPKFFQLGTLCTAVMILSGWRLGLPVGPAIASLVFTLMNLLYLEPESTRVMFERYDRDNKGLKDVEVSKKLKSRFNKLHGMSSLANLFALVALVAHGAYLSTRL